MFSRLFALGAVLRISGSLLGPLGGLLGASWRLLGRLLGPLGALLGRSWEPSGRSWGHVGGDLSKKGGSPINPAPLECLESPLGPPKRPKSFQNLGKINLLLLSRFFALGAVLRISGSLLGPLGGLLGASWRLLGCLLGRLGALLGRSWGALGSLRAAFGAILDEIYQRRGEL